MKRDDNDAFGRQLREAGTGLTPTTSEELHARVMADVRRERAATASTSAARPREAWWWMIGAAVTAVAVGIGIWLTTSHAPAPDETPMAHIDVTPPVPPSPLIEKVVVVDRVSPIRAKLHEARFAYIDRDTKRLARFLIRAVPGMPEDAREQATPGL